MLPRAIGLHSWQWVTSKFMTDLGFARISRRHMRFCNNTHRLKTTRYAASGSNSRRTMNSTAHGHLWNPKHGIRFSPPPAPKSLYPTLDISRYCQNAAYQEAEMPEASADDSFTLRSEFRNTNEEDLLDQKLSTDLEEVNAMLDTHDAASGFKIVDELFNLARTSEPGSPQSFWSHTMYRRETTDGSFDNVKVHYCTSKHTMENVCKKYFVGEPILGFDLEWMAYAKRGAGPRETVSLIQLASPSRIGLFHVAMFPKDDFVSPTFRDIMENSSVSKVGVNILGDCTRLRKQLNVHTRGIFELSHLYKQVRYLPEGKRHLINKHIVALATQVQEVLRLPMYKGVSVRESNWMKSLNEAQIKYSASDAYAGIQLYYALERSRKQLEPVPDRPSHAELGLPIPLPDPIETLDDHMANSDEANSENEDAARLANDDLNIASPANRKFAVQDPRIIAADIKAIEHRAMCQTGMAKTARSALRSYYIWHSNEDLDPESMANLLRDPPLKTLTVVCYILDSIVQEKVAYNKARLKGEVISLLDAKMLTGSKYKSLIKACEGDD